MEEKIYTCGLCYRETKETDMKKNIMGLPTEYCGNCYDMFIGKGAGYADPFTDKEREEWMVGSEERRNKYKEKEAQNEISNQM